MSALECLQTLNMDEWTPAEGTHSRGSRITYSTAELRRIAQNAAKREGGKLVRWAIAVGEGPFDTGPSLHISYLVGSTVRFTNVSV